MAKYGVYDRKGKTKTFDSILKARIYAVRNFVELSDPTASRRMVEIVNPSTMNNVEIVFIRNILGMPHFYVEKMNKRGETYNIYEFDPKSGELKR